MIQERLKELRAQMQERGIDIYIVPTSDFHQSEYVGEYFKARKYMTGFTGSAGTAVITKEEAGLWTDGRYFIQAEKQLEGSTVKLFKMGEEGVPKVEEYVKDHLTEGSCIGFDGRVMDAKSGEKYGRGEKGGSLCQRGLSRKYLEGQTATSGKQSLDLRGCLCRKKHGR